MLFVYKLVLNVIGSIFLLIYHYSNSRISSSSYCSSNQTPTPNNNNNNTSSTLKREDTFLIITHQETKVLQSLKNKMKSVEKYQNKFNKIQKEYEIHKIEAKNLCTKEMENIDNLINETFEKLHAALDKQQEILLNKSNRIKQSECEFNSNKGPLSNFNKEIKQCFNSLQIQKELLENSINKYQNIMTNSTQCMLSCLCLFYLLS